MHSPDRPLSGSTYGISDHFHHQLVLGRLCWLVARIRGNLLFGLIEAWTVYSSLSSIQAQSLAYAEGTLVGSPLGRQPQKTDYPGDASKPEPPECLHHLLFLNRF